MNNPNFLTNSHADSNSRDSELAAVLSKNKQLILKAWELLAREKIPAAKDKPNPALMNSIPKVIDKIIETLASKSPYEQLMKEEKDLAMDHGKERAYMEDYTIDQIIFEYNLLRQVIFEVIDPDGDMTLKQAKMIWDSIFIAIKNAASRFSEIRESEKVKLHEALKGTHDILHDKYQAKTSEAKGLKIEQKMRESFVSSLAHDLRSPLTAAKVSAQLILKNPTDNDKVLTLSQKIVDNITRTDKMISNLLDANRISAGEKIHLDLKECDITKIAHDVCEDLSTIYPHRIKVFSDHQIIGFWDEDCLIRIFENLITNALKYGDAKNLVSITVTEIENNTIIKVHNFGKVIDKINQAKLFEPYQRMEKESNGTKGWGLGLTLVKGLVEAHHGTVKVESYPVKGTTFTVELPLNSANH